MNKAFTLVELAIVLVIIGLIVGGVLGAQSLIESSNRQEIVKDIRKFSTAINAFQLEYNALPGDFTEAEDYWGASNTTNGNGDKKINAGLYYYEEIGIWNHLGLAEILDTKFNDHNSYVYDSSRPDRVFPKGPFGNTYWVLDDFYTHSSRAGQTIHNATALGLVNIDVTSTNYFGLSQDPSMTSKEIYKIDKKIDDGLPYDGNVIGTAYNLAGSALNVSHANCHSNTSIGSEVYNTSGVEVFCAPLFIVHSSSGKFSSLF